MVASGHFAFGFDRLVCLFQGPLSAHFQHQFTGADVRAYFFAVIMSLTDWTRDLAAACLGLSIIPLVIAIVTAPARGRPQLVIAYCSAALQLLLWQLALAPLDVACDLGLAAATQTINTEFVQGAVSYVGVRVLAAYSLAIFIAITWAARWHWARTHPGPAWPPKFPPRLILAILAQVWLFIASVLLVSLSMLTALDEIAPNKVPIAAAVDQFFESIDGQMKLALLVVWPITIGLSCCAFVFETRVRDGLHVVTDVVNHFYQPKEDFPVRRQIEARFRTVFTRLVNQHRPTRVLIIAHSQGTVITFNALYQICSQSQSQSLAGKQPIDLVTVGSPLTHLYQHYFPVEYPANDRKFSTLLKFVRCWRNIFRVDDFVGTFVSIGSNNPQTQSWPQNISAAPGGHTNYWRPDIFEHLKDLV